MDGMTILAFAILGAVAIYLLIQLVKLIIRFSKWLWGYIFRAPCCWVAKNCCKPCCDCCRFGVYSTKESCCACYDCCDLHHNPWKRMEIAS